MLKNFTCNLRLVTALTLAAALWAACLGAAPKRDVSVTPLGDATRAVEMGRNFDLNLTLLNAGEQEAMVREIHLPASILSQPPCLARSAMMLLTGWPSRTRGVSIISAT